MPDNKKYFVVYVDRVPFEIVTLGNGSYIDLLEQGHCCVHPAFWIELQYEIESTLNVRVINMELRGLELKQPLGSASVKIMHIIHTPVLDVDLAKMMAREEIAELHRITGIESSVPVMQ